MTIAQAIAQADAMRPNVISPDIKIELLSHLDGRIYNEILKECEVLEGETLPDTFTGYTSSTAQTTALLTPYPYDDLYPLHLVAHYDLINREYDSWNNMIAMFNTTYVNFSDAWRRTHMPIPKVVNVAL